MSRIVTIHQPNYLPWIGLFSKLSAANYFIIYDCAQYVKQSVINRNKIRTGTGTVYLTIPIRKDAYLTRIKDIKLPENARWRNDHWYTILYNYVKCPHFKELQDSFEYFYKQDYKSLCDLNVDMLKYMLKKIELDMEIVKASDLEINPELKSTDFILSALKRVEADVYISGPSGRDYLDVNKFIENKIELKYFQFQHPIYQQRYPDFVPNLAAIDLLFNTGNKAKDFIRSSGCLTDPN